MRSRREFLKTVTFLSTGLAAPGFLVRTVEGSGLGCPGGPAADGRILVVLELAGGCDGLNTVIPFGKDAYYSARPSVAVHESQGILKISEGTGFHPSLTGVKELWDEGRVAVVRGVGYPNPNRSHFKSRDIWHTADSEGAQRGGWLAEYFALNSPGGSLEGLNIGGKVPLAMTSEEGSAPSIQNVESYQLNTDPKYAGVDESNKLAAFQKILSESHNRYPLQEYVSRTILDATYSSTQLLEGRDEYQSSVEYPETFLAQNLKTVARIIAADIGVKVFYTTISGFDTHAGQVVSGNSIAGTHASLLQTLSDALKVFLDDLTEMGRSQDVLLMTFSEFGRRLRENGSLGTDHGTANNMLLIGGGAVPGLYGPEPRLDPGSLDPVGDMIYSVDFRSVYATVLSAWLGADSNAVLGQDWSDPVLQGLITG